MHGQTRCAYFTCTYITKLYVLSNYANIVFIIVYFVLFHKLNLSYSFMLQTTFTEFSSIIKFTLVFTPLRTVTSNKTKHKQKTKYSWTIHEYTVKRHYVNLTLNRLLHSFFVSDFPVFSHLKED